MSRCADNPGQTKKGGSGMNEGKVAVIVVLLMVLLGFTACAPTTSLKSVWQDEAREKRYLHKVLIIGIDRSETIKVLLEDEFAAELRARGADAVQAHRIFPEEEILNKRAIASKIQELQVDALLIVALKDVAETGLYETHPSYYTEGGGYYGYYLRCCQIVSVGRNVVIETRVFDAGSDRLIWSAVTETMFEGSAEMAVRSFAPAIIAELYSSTLLGQP